MSFPDAPIDLRAELLLNGTWTDISDYGYNNGDYSGCTITRGKADESAQASPSSMTTGLNNADGRFTARNPSGAYYPNLIKNTQVRVSVPEEHSYLRLETDGFGYCSSPDSAALSITGDTEIQIDITLDNWSDDQVLCSKWTAGGNQRSWILLVNEDSTLTFSWSASGTAATMHTATSSQAVSAPALRRSAIKVTLATATGTVTFYTADTISGSWTQLGTAQVLGAFSVFDSTAAIRIGAPGTTVTSDFTSYPGMLGKVHAFKLLSGIGGTVKASPDFTAQSAGTTSFSDSQSNTWTVTGSTPHPEISDRNYRFHGEVASWPQTWDPTGNYVAVSVTANGLLKASRPVLQAAQVSDVPLLDDRCQHRSGGLLVAGGRHQGQGLRLRAERRQADDRDLRHA